MRDKNIHTCEKEGRVVLCGKLGDHEGCPRVRRRCLFARHAVSSTRFTTSVFAGRGSSVVAVKQMMGVLRRALGAHAELNSVRVRGE